VNSGLLRYAAGMIVLAAVLIGAAVFGTASLERSGALRAATAAEQSQSLLTAMLDQESGARGYFQTRDIVFLEPWYKGTRDFAVALAAARATARGDSVLEQSLRTEAAIASVWHAGVQALITRLHSSSRPPTVPESLADKAEMDSFRAANASVGAELASRRNESLLKATILSVLLAVLLTIVLACSGLYLIRRSVRHAATGRRHSAELRELLQASQTEEESRRLLIRHLERTIPGAGAAVMNRNNSDDRLEPSIGRQPAVAGLHAVGPAALQPRSCLAIRLSRPYSRHRGEETLAECGVCGKLAGDVACEPLLVGGQVIGSVLVARDRGTISPPALSQIRDVVIQAAPIIANQRNLSLAETRAASDALTGLPNRRAADDTIKRMVAHAGRTLNPLSVLLVDLDHFKQINDRHGHEHGDEALAAVGNALAGTLRASDFAARFGGEEFLVLLPECGREEARQVAEKLRFAIRELDLQSGRVTASFGVASLPDDATDAEGLLRKADRALYAAKQAGRDRVAQALSTIAPRPREDGRPDDGPARD
jgi:diguanylate cyclase (GGDEF)-like protein